MATRNISYFGNNLIVYDDTVFATEVGSDNGIATVTLYRLANRAQEACVIVGGIIILWKPFGTLALTAMTVGQGIKVTVT